MQYFTKSLLILLLIFAKPLLAQKNGIHQFNRSNGFENAFIYEIQQTPRGYITVSSNYGFYAYDGSIFNNLKFSETNGNVRSLSHQVINDDSIFIAIDESIILFNLRSNKILKSWKTSEHVIKKLILDKNKNIWALNGNNDILVIRKNSNQLDLFYSAEGTLIYDVLIKDENQIFLATSDGFKTLKNKTLTAINLDIDNELSITKFNNESIILQEKNSNKYIIYNIVNNTIIFNKNNNNGSGIHSSAFQRKQNIALFYNNATGMSELEYNLKKNNYSEKSIIKPSEFISHKINNVFIDKENNYWLGSKGGGIYKIDFNPFINKTLFEKNENIINCITAIDDYVSLLGTDKGLMMVFVDKESNLISTEALSFTKPVQRLFKLRSGKIYFTSDSALFEFKDGNVSRLDLGNSWKLSSDLNDIYDVNNMIYLSTNDGIIAFNNETKKETIWTTNELLLHNSVYKLVKNKQGELWVISPYTLPYSIFNNQVKKINPAIIKNLFFDPTSVAIIDNDQLWFGTKGDGLFSYNGNEIKKYNKDNGLISNTILNVLTDKVNKIWAVHESGISILKIKNASTSILKTIAFPDDFDATQMQANAACFGTKHGLFFHNQSTIYYLNDTMGDNQNRFLNLFIKNIKVNNEGIEDINNTINLSHGYYRVEFEFQTIFLQKPSMVKYAYRLLGSEDTTWIEKKYTEPELILPNLSDGTHIIQLKSYLSDDSQFSKVITYEINIASAIYKKWWFWLLSVGLITAMIVSFIQFRINKIKKDKVALERLVGKRTHELEKEKDNLKLAKDIIEQKTIAITESIEYARKIQLSSLPLIENLDDKAKDLLIFARPRDIVSGDFYWFKRINNQILISVFDCTGHGVPAGFISMIGINLIAKIVNDGLFNNPAEILNQINNRLLNELNPETEIELYNTAMDAAIALIDLDKMHVTFAGAARPIVIVSDEKADIVKGNNISIGGYNSKLREPFTNIEIDIKKNDTIYLFSDGYADQFNSTTKKRFFNKQLLDLLAAISIYGIDEQQEKLQDNLTTWKNNANQTDDILIVGFKI